MYRKPAINMHLFIYLFIIISILVKETYAMPNRFMAENREKTMSVSCLPSLLLSLLHSAIHFHPVSFPRGVYKEMSSILSDLADLSALVYEAKCGGRGEMRGLSQ
jgi:hypothetical protein